MGWSWAAAYGGQGRGYIVRPRAHLVYYANSPKRCMLFLCYAAARLSGLSPFAGGDDQDTLHNVRRCDWKFDDESFRGISDHAKDFIKKLLLKVPQ